jgi:hypothetical protein
LKAKALSNEEQAQALYVLLQSLNQKGRLPWRPQILSTIGPMNSL